MKNYILPIILVATLLACKTDEEVNSPYDALSDIISTVYGESNIKSQHFTIDNSVDNTLEGEQGTILKIDKNTFVDSNGEAIQSEIKIELREALDPIDMVMGNLTTTSNGEALESGGMIYLNATCEERIVKIASDKAISATIPSEDPLQDMSIYKGVVDSNQMVNWVDPQPIDNPEEEDEPEVIEIVEEKSHNIRYHVSLDGQITQSYPKEIDAEVSRVAWQGDGLKITKDSTFEFMGHTIIFYKQDELDWDRTIHTAQKGENNYITDQNIGYIFEIKELGWANIDRLLDDPRTEGVNLLVEISNNSEFGYVYTTLITQRMYLPGYEKKDDSYSFTHGDYESTQLPIGETATIIATALKDGKTHFALKTIIIQKNQEVVLDLAVQSKEEIANILEAEI